MTEWKSKHRVGIYTVYYLGDSGVDCCRVAMVSMFRVTVVHVQKDRLRQGTGIHMPWHDRQLADFWESWEIDRTQTISSAIVRSLLHRGADTEAIFDSLEAVKPLYEYVIYTDTVDDPEKLNEFINPFL